MIYFYENIILDNLYILCWTSNLDTFKYQNKYIKSNNIFQKQYFNVYLSNEFVNLRTQMIHSLMVQIFFIYPFKNTTCHIPRRASFCHKSEGSFPDFLHIHRRYNCRRCYSCRHPRYNCSILTLSKMIKDLYYRQYCP